MSTAEFQLPVKGADLESAGPLCQFTVAELSGVMSWKAPRFQWLFLPLFVHILHSYKLQSCSTIISSLYFTHENSVKQSHCRKGPIRQICPLKALLQLTENVSDQVVSKPLIRCISLTLLLLLLLLVLLFLRSVPFMVYWDPQCSHAYLWSNYSFRGDTSFFSALSSH